MRNTLPILPGYYPDPSVCRVGDTFWLVSSSFESFPALPVHRSTDLVHWEQVGHVYERPSALPLPLGDAPSMGTFAPTIRHRAGVFYTVVTNMGQDPLGQRITRTTDPAGGWSDPVLVPGTPGIDPDLTWDEEGVCHLSWRAVSFTDGTAVSTLTTAPIDPDTGERLGDAVVLWQGTGGRDAEGPHLFRRRGWWYLLLAEGGTGLGHMVTMARARSLEGPWEECPSNPVLTHRSTDHPVQATGHADLVPLDADADHPDGDWDGTRFAMVHLGIRPLEPFPGYHVIGRETFVVGVDWSGDWPVIDEEAFVEAIAHREERVSRSFDDDLRGDGGPVAPGDAPWSLGDRWVSSGGLARRALERDEEGRLRITAPDDAGARPLLMTRCTDHRWRAEARLALLPGAVADLCVYLTPEHWVAVRCEEGGVIALAQVLSLSQVLGERVEVPAGADGCVHVWAEARLPQAAVFGAQVPDSLAVGVRTPQGDVELGSLDGRFLSTEVAGGFTGRLVGVRALAGSTRVEGFSYTAG